MYSRTAILEAKDVEDKFKLYKFIVEIRSNSMYEVILESLFAAKGFIRKETKFIDYPKGSKCYSSVVFEDKETFDNYYSREDTSFVWNYLESISEAYEINCSIEDKDD